MPPNNAITADYVKMVLSAIGLRASRFSLDGRCDWFFFVFEAW